jgi:Dolichyl-phosphate-mannose-protein mannosyltransferase
VKPIHFRFLDGRHVPHGYLILLVIPLALSCFTHFWNPLGFLAPEHDENRYMQRVMNLLNGMGPSDAKSRYDAPYFGQLFVAGVLGTIGYPNSLSPSASAYDNVHSIEALWMAPRLLMGVLAVFDTLLVYKISKRRYNRYVAFFAAVLFAVLPTTLLLRRVWLESILLPFLLSAILFALYSYDSTKINKHSKKILLILLSGIFLGVSIFTKITAFTMIPLVGFLIYGNTRSLKIVALWFIPVILIPLIWPLHAISIGELDKWFNGIYDQTHRTTYSSFLRSIKENLDHDPVLLTIGFVGIIYASLKRDFFLLLWILPFAGFSYFIGWTQFFHFILIFPAFCIAAARLIVDISSMFSNKRIRQLLPFVSISAIAIFGLVTTSVIITDNFTKPYYEAAAFITHYLADVVQNNNKNSTEINSDNRITLISNPFYLWIPQYVFHLNHDYTDFLSVGHIKTQKVILIVDGRFRREMLNNIYAGDWLRKIYESYDNKTISRIKDISILSYDTLRPSLRVKPLNLADGSYVWKAWEPASVWQEHNILSIHVNTNNTNETFTHAYMSTRINSTSDEPLFLTIEYSTYPPNGTTTYVAEMKDISKGKSLWHAKLDNTFGQTATNTFVLPNDIVGKEVELRINVIIQQPGGYSIAVRNIMII